MGDRANFVFEQENGDRIFLYGHWAGEGMMNRLATALERAESRWSDESYATRITISQIIGDEWNQELSWGISTYLTDNEHSVPVVSWSSKTVTLYDGDMKEIKFIMPLETFVNKFAKSLTNV